jgi:hypothetical protein
VESVGSLQLHAIVLKAKILLEAPGAVILVIGCCLGNLLFDGRVLA